MEMINLKIKSRITAVIIAIVMIFTLCACGEKKEAELPTVDKTAEWIIEKVAQPTFGSIGGEWVVMGLARAGVQVPEGYFEGYYERLEQKVTECGGVLSEKKYTEYSRTVIALTAIGKDPVNVAGYNLLAPLGFFEQTVFQGVNGAAYALLALDCGDYDVPAYTGEGTQATREMYVDYILEKELEGGGWSLAGGPAETDLTAMVLQSLAKYTDKKEVSDAVDRGLEILSGMQQQNGGFNTDEEDSCETIVQVIVALCELGIDVDSKSFVKDGNTLLTRLSEFQFKDGGFMHMLDGEKADIMATEQVLYALVALDRSENGKTTLYDMSDVAK